MSTITYNGVELAIDRTASFRADPVMSPRDGVDYLYTHITIEVVCVFNPWTQPRANMNVIGDMLPQQMRDYLKEKLEPPRKKLIYQVGDQIVIETPKVGDVCDCNDGPNPLYARVVEIVGDKSAIVAFGIECWVSDCKNIVVSNRWMMQSYTNEDAFTTRYINGVAKLRADLMQKAKLTADDFRPFYFPPCPIQFKRDLVQCQLSSDGTELAYTITDRQQALAIGDGIVPNDNPLSGIYRIEGAITAGIHYDFDRVKSFGAGLFGAGVGLAVGTVIGGLAGGQAGVNLGFRAGSTLYSSVANNRANCFIRVYGDITANRQNMAQIAMAVASERLFFLFGFPGNIFTAPILSLPVFGSVLVSAHLTQSLEERMVQLRCEVMPSLKAKIFTSAFNFDFGQVMNMNDDMIGTFNQAAIRFLSGITIDRSGKCPVFYNVNSRGSYDGVLLAQALGVQCEVPATPPKERKYAPETKLR